MWPALEGCFGPPPQHLYYPFRKHLERPLTLVSRLSNQTTFKGVNLSRPSFTYDQPPQRPRPSPSLIKPLINEWSSNL